MLHVSFVLLRHRRRGKEIQEVHLGGCCSEGRFFLLFFFFKNGTPFSNLKKDLTLLLTTFYQNGMNEYLNCVQFTMYSIGDLLN